MGLDAMEYEAVRGVNISEEKARVFGKLAKENDVVLSLHAPYYVNLSAVQKETVEASKKRIIDSLKATEWMNGYIVVFHPGYYLDWGQKEAVKRVIDALKEVRDEANRLGIAKDVWLGPETTGKKKQVGSVDDIIEICNNVEKCRPAVDWAHLHARTLGVFPRNVDEVIKVIERFEKEIGSYAIKPLHTHFSKIEYTSGGEKEHHTLDEEYGPEFKVICEAYKQTGIDAIIISESPILERDALKMKNVCKEECEQD